MPTPSKKKQKKDPHTREEIMEGLRHYRKKHFNIRIRKQDPLFKNEFVLEVTHNGNQWHGITIAPHELKKIMTVLRKKEKQFNKNHKIR